MISGWGWGPLSALYSHNVTYRSFGTVGKIVGAVNAALRRINELDWIGCSKPMRDPSAILPSKISQ